MANPNPSQRTRFHAGNNANPRGAAAHSPLLKEIRKLTNEQLLDVLNLVVLGNISELRAIAKDPKVSVLKAMIAAAAIRVVDKGDVHAFDVLLNRLVGRNKESAETSSGAAIGPQVIVTLPSNGRERRPT